MDIRGGFSKGWDAGLGEAMSIGEDIVACDYFLEDAAVPRRAVERDNDNTASRESYVSAEEEST